MWCAGRVDDVINVSGHRIGTAEVESALVNHPACAEAAVVPVEHPIKGQGIYAFITLMDVRMQPVASCLCLQCVSPKHSASNWLPGSVGQKCTGLDFLHERPGSAVRASRCCWPIIEGKLEPKKLWNWQDII